MSDNDPRGRGTSAWVHAIRLRRFATTEKLLLMVLTDYIDADDECWPGNVRIAEEVGVTERTVRRLLNGLIEAGIIEKRRRQRKEGRGKDYDVIWLSWEGFQTFPLTIVLPDKMSTKTSVLPDIQSSVLPDKMSGKKAVLPDKMSTKTERSSGHSEQRSSGHSEQPSSFRTPSLKPEPLEPKRSPSKPSVSPPSDFDRWWRAYPAKRAKADALKAWPKALRAAGDDAQRLIDAAERYRDDPNREPAFTAHPATWLHGGRWDDEALPPRLGANRNGAGANQAVAALAEYRRREGRA